MKKITVIVTALVLFTAGSLSAQSRPQESMSINYTKITYSTATATPATKDPAKNKAAVKPATPAPKPKPVAKVGQSNPGTKANDYLLELGDIKGESKN